MVHVFDLASEVLQRSRLWTHPEIPFQFKLHAGDPRLLLIAGENASGKSLFAQCLASLAHRQDIAPITVSIRERTEEKVFAHREVWKHLPALRDV